MYLPTLVHYLQQSGFSSLAAVSVLSIFAVAAGLVQGSIGFGMGIVLIPIFALYAPAQAPQVLLLITLPALMYMTVREHSAIVSSGLGWLIIGRALGTGAGVLVVVAVTTEQLQFLLILSVFITVGLVFFRPSGEGRTPGRQLAVGGGSGLMGTVSGLGGPILAINYYYVEGPGLRSTLSTIFLMGNSLSIIGLAVAGRVSWLDVRMAVLLSIPMAVGLGSSGAVIGRISGPALRTSVLVVSSCSAVVVLARLLGGWIAA